ncbi:hypothetical protein, partial [Pseudomonas aeruginosa]
HRAEGDAFGNHRLLPTVQEAAHREHRRLLAAWDA